MAIKVSATDFVEMVIKVSKTDFVEMAAINVSAILSKWLYKFRQLILSN